MNNQAYIIRYLVITHFQGEDGLSAVRNYRTVVVRAKDKVEAFIKAYWKIVAQGYDVETVSDLDDVRVFDGDGYTYQRTGIANLSYSEMEQVFTAGIPKVSVRGLTSIAHVESVNEYPLSEMSDVERENTPSQDASGFVSHERLNALIALDGAKGFDLTKLIELCRELNVSFISKSFYSVAILSRALLDHVPPVFGCSTFAEVANNYKGAKSFKAHMVHLDKSSRKIADSHLHEQIRTCPNIHFLERKLVANFLRLMWISKFFS